MNHLRPSVRRLAIAAVAVAASLLLTAGTRGEAASHAASPSWSDVFSRGKFQGDVLLKKILDPQFLWTVALIVGAIAIFMLLRAVVRGVKRFVRRLREKISGRSTDVVSAADLERRYRALFEHANDFILGATLTGKLLYASRSWQEAMDFPEREIGDLTLERIIHPDNAAGFAQAMRRAIAGMKVQQIELTLVSKFGKRIVVEGSVHCELVNDEPASLQCIFRDITERKKAASALKQSEERFSRVFAASPVAICISTLADGKILDANESFLKMLDLDSRSDVLGREETHLDFWAAPEDRNKIVARLQQHEVVRDYQCKLRTRKHAMRDALIAAELVEINGEQSLVLIIHDNTERLNLEGQLRQAQKMDGIGQLAAGVAHDFNNILTVIQGHAGRLHKVDELPQRIRESVEQVTVAADRAANLTRQLLTFCRKQAMVTKPINLSEVVGNVSNMLSRLLGENVVLDVRQAGDLPLIDADSAMLELCVINLACNARDAMPKGGRLTITTFLADIAPHYVQQRPKARPGRHVCLNVTDTGCGMKPEVMAKIFEPFFTTKEVGKGTGLGLATVYGIIEQHRGWIEVASEPGKGTTFKIFLPLATKQRVTTTESLPSPADVPRGKETILLVEDEELVRELARMVLEDYNYKVLEAGSGVQALKVWEKHKNEIDLLLTDMVMPEGMTGRDLAERVQEEKPGLKVLYSSGYSPDVVGGYFKLPENSFFLAKPYHPPKLAQAVRECLDHRGNPARRSEPALIAA